MSVAFYIPSDAYENIAVVQNGYNALPLGSSAIGHCVTLLRAWSLECGSYDVRMGGTEQYIVACVAERCLRDRFCALPR